MRIEERRRRIALLTKRDGPGCFYCGEQLREDEITFDHYIPLSRGGTWDDANLRISCQPCNNRKSDRVPDGKNHPVPPPRPPRKSRAEKAKIRQMRVPCSDCKNGRTIEVGEFCDSCGREAYPKKRNHLYRARLGSCDHTYTWCMICTIFPEEIRLRAG